MCYGIDLTWDEKITQHRHQLELLVAEIQATEIINGLPSDVTTTRQCEKFEENSEMVNVNRSEEGG